MLLEIIKQFNWLDYAVMLISLRILYVSARNGFVVELFKLSGIIIALYMSFHYYTAAADYLKERVSLGNHFPLEFLDFLVFIALVFVSYSLFVLLRSFVCNFVKMEAVPTLSKWGGFLLGIFRAVLTPGLIVFILFISSITYLSSSVHQSYYGKRLFNLTVATYSRLWDGLMSKFMTNEKFNQTISEMQEKFNR